MRQNGKEQLYRRDILRDYALASAELGAQFKRFEESGVLSFSIIRGLVGEPHCKGLLWQLKDTAHHLFSAGHNGSIAAKQLDWAIGFLFHECIIILESSYQMQKYYPSAQKFIQNIPPQNDLADMLRSLHRLSGETQDKLSSSIGRVKSLLAAINLIMREYLAGDKQNRPLARLFYDREDLLRAVFGNGYEALATAVFGQGREKALALAGLSLLESGHLARAERAAHKALTLNPGCPDARDLLDKVRLVRQ